MEEFYKLLKKFQTSLISEHIVTGLLFFILSAETFILFSFFSEPGLTRSIVLAGFIIGLVIALVEILINVIRFSSRFRVAKFIEKQNPELKDYVTTTLNLPQISDKYYSKTLINKALQDATAKIKHINPLHRVGEQVSLLTRLSTFMIIIFLLVSVVQPFESLQRIEQLITGKNYIKPGTKILLSRYGGKLVEGERFSFRIIPLRDDIEKIQVYIYSSVSGDKKLFSTIADIESDIRINFPNLTEDFKYSVTADDQSFGPYSVEVVKKPSITGILAGIIPPDYTQLKPYSSNSGSFEVPAGSRVTLAFTFNKKINFARLDVLGKDTRFQGKVKGNLAEFEFTPEADMNYRLFVLDSDTIAHQSNPELIKVIEDTPPIVKIISPGKDLKLINTDEKVHLDIFTKDDYGIRKARLIFTISDSGDEYRVPLKTYQSITEQDKIPFTWPLSVLDIKVTDYITYFVEVLDNKEPQPQLGRSSSFTIYFKDSKEQVEEFVDQQEDIIDTLKDFKSENDAIQLELNALMKKYELQKEDKLTWSDKKKLNELKTRQEELITKGEKLKQDLKEMDKNYDLGSEEFNTIDEKLEKVREMFDRVVDKEMKDILNKLQDLLNKDLHNPHQKNDQIKQDTEKLNEMLDRMINELNRLKTEKDIEQMISKIDELVKKQEEIRKKIGDDNEAALADEQKEITESIKDLEKQLSEAIDSLKDLKPEDATGLEKTEANADFKGMKQDSEQAEDGIRQKKNKQADKKANDVKNNLKRLRRNLRKDLDEIKMKGSDGQVDLINLLIKEGIENARYLNQVMDEIERNKYRIGRNSSFEKDDVLNSLDILDRQLKNYMGLLSELGMLTIMLDDTLINRIRASKRSLSSASAKIIDGIATNSRGYTNEAYRNINLTVLDLMKLKFEMQSCESCDSQSMEQLLKMLEKLAQRQGDLNEMLKKLAEQMKNNPDRSEMKIFDQMAKEQKAIREALQKLNQQLKDMEADKKTLGDLDQVGKDMEEVEKRIEKPDIGRETREKQRKILQRLLDAQKSIHQQDFEKKRRAELDNKKMLDEMMKTPEIQEQDMFMDLESFWKEGYPEEYREYLKSYFENLNQ